MLYLESKLIFIYSSSSQNTSLGKLIFFIMFSLVEVNDKKTTRTDKTKGILREKIADGATAGKANLFMVMRVKPSGLAASQQLCHKKTG